MEKAVLVGIKFKNEPIPLSESLEELTKLAQTAEAEAVYTLTQTKDKPDQKYFIGSGKLEELKSICRNRKIDLVIFDHELSSSQARNLEAALETKVVDRAELILDIFAQHAFSHEGKLQVELAQLNFRLTHLTGYGTALSRLGGGIGTRGPGETKLEMDRRRIRKRISLLKRDLEKIRRHRQVQRAKRKANQMKVAAIIGYTNSGKSTLLNSLTRSEVLSEDKLFATLDPVTRRLFIKDHKTVLLTDTVGFIQKLPHHLINAFRATLEETIEADLLLHIIDTSSEYTEHQIEAVYQTLEELNILKTPILNVFNKIDENQASQNLHLAKKFKPAVVISALYKKGLDDLVSEIAKIL